MEQLTIIVDESIVSKARGLAMERSCSVDEVIAMLVLDAPAPKPGVPAMSAEGAKLLATIDQIASLPLENPGGFTSHDIDRVLYGSNP